LNLNDHALPQISTELLLAGYTEARKFTEDLCEPLEIEDYIIQSMPDVSPTRWHLAHTSWFFETFILKPEQPDYQTPNELFSYLFNSYYNAIGDQFPRPKRGLLSRPTVKEVIAYRHHVDAAMKTFISEMEEDVRDRLAALIVLGINHEQQHQELMITDIKHVFSQNPLNPVLAVNAAVAPEPEDCALQWVEFGEQLATIGYPGTGFHFDNEGPPHQVLVRSFEMASRPTTNAEYLNFIEDGGYQRPELWLSDGWAQVCEHEWEAPLYWRRVQDEWREFSTRGLQALNLLEPVTHISYYEADAYATWADSRLPSEQEWELASEMVGLRGQFSEDQLFHPTPCSNGDRGLHQMMGSVWEWTASSYSPYPGFRAPAGAVGEYNGKFMINQNVLRGGSCATPAGHIRKSYRNFFHPHCRWQFSGLRLARDLEE